MPKPIWTPELDALLGTMLDNELAVKLRCTTQTIFLRRHKLRIAPFIKPPIASPMDNEMNKTPIRDLSAGDYLKTVQKLTKRRTRE